MGGSYARIHFTEIFGPGSVFLPVIHAEKSATAMRNVRIAHEAGAHGVFMISHRRTSFDLNTMIKQVRKAFPHLWVGANFLRERMPDVLSVLPQGIDGLWTDQSGLNESHNVPDFAATLFRNEWLRRGNDKSHLWFGGFDFKGQPPVENVEKMVEHARKHMDVITTSGPATGQPASVEKVERLRAVSGDHPLGLASGVSVENVSNYLGLVDAFLVSSSISRQGTDAFDADKVFELCELIRTSGS